MVVPVSMVVRQGRQVTSPAALVAPPVSSRVCPFMDVVKRPRTRRLSCSCDEFLLLRHLRPSHVPPHPLFSPPPLGHAIAPSPQPLGRRVHTLLQLRRIRGSEPRASRTPAWRLIRAATTSARRRQRQDDAGEPAAAVRAVGSLASFRHAMRCCVQQCTLPAAAPAGRYSGTARTHRAPTPEPRSATRAATRAGPPRSPRRPPQPAQLPEAAKAHQTRLARVCAGRARTIAQAKVRCGQCEQRGRLFGRARQRRKVGEGRGRGAAGRARWVRPQCDARGARAGAAAAEHARRQLASRSTGALCGRPSWVLTIGS